MSSSQAALPDRQGHPPTRPIDAIEHELGRLAGRLSRVRLDATEIALERAAYALLRELEAAGPERLTAVAARMGLDASTVSRQAAALEAAGLIARDPDPSDRRAHLLRVSERGADVLRQTRAARRGLFLQVMASWSDADRGRFARLLRRFNDEIAEVAL